jgi:hypothetical protein
MDSSLIHVDDERGMHLSATEIQLREAVSTSSLHMGPCEKVAWC